MSDAYFDELRANALTLMINPQRVAELRTRYGSASSNDPAEIFAKVDEILEGERLRALPSIAPIATTASAPVEESLAAGGERRSLPTDARTWRTEWAASLALQEEFASVDSYVAFKHADATGLVHIVGPKVPVDDGQTRSLEAGGGQRSLPASAPKFAKRSDTWRAEWAASRALQDEFASVDSYVAFKRAHAEGLVRIVRQKIEVH